MHPLMILCFLACAVQSGEASVDPRHGFVQAIDEADAALRARDLSSARRGYSLALEHSPENASVAYGLACVEARAGNVERALNELRCAADWGYPDAAVALWDEDLALLRGNDRFDEIVTRLRAKAGEREVSARFRCKTREVPPKHDVERDRNDVTWIQATISRTGDRIALGHPTGEVSIVDPSTARTLSRIDLQGDSIWDLAFHPDDRRLAVLSYDGVVTLIDHRTGDRLFTKQLFGMGNTLRFAFGAQLEWNSAGSKLLIVAGMRPGVVLDDEGELLFQAKGSFGSFFDSQARWNPDGDTIAFQKGSILVLLDAENGKELRTIDVGAPTRSVAFSPDGRLIAAGTEGAGTAHVYSLDTGERIRSLSSRDWFPEGSYVAFMEFSPDSKQLAFSTGTSVVVHVDEVDEPVEVFTSDHLGGRGGEPVHARFSSDGRSLWYGYLSGALRFARVDLETREATRFSKARAPILSDANLGIAETYRGVALFDANTGVFLWYRIQLFDGSSLTQSPAGHLWGPIPRDSELIQDYDQSYATRAGEAPATTGDESNSVLDRVDRIYDPKRVRAGMAGVALCSP